MRRRIIGFDKGLGDPLELPWRGRSGELVVEQAALDVEMRFHPIEIAFPFGTLHRLVVNLQAHAHRFKLVGGEGPTAVRDERFRGAIAQTGRIEDHQGHPTGFRGCHRAREYSPRVAFEHNEAPPANALQRKVHHPSVNEPKLMRSGGFIRLRLRGFWRRVFPIMWDIIIDLPIEGHDPPDRAYGDILAGQQTPDTELPGIGMGFLEMIHVDHEREPDLPRGLRTGLEAHEPGKVLGCTAANPAIDRRTRDVQKATDTALRPSLILEFDHLKAALVASGLAVVGGQGQRPVHRSGTLLPKLFDRLVVNTLLRLVPENPGQFALAKAVVQRFEARQFLHHGFGDHLPTTWDDDFRLRRQEPHHALVPKATREIPHRFGVKLGLLCPLGHGAIAQQDDGTDHFIAPLHAIDKVELELGIL